VTTQPRVTRVDGSSACLVAPLLTATGFDLDLCAELSQTWAELWAVEARTPGSFDAFLLVHAAADEFQIIAIGSHPDRRRAGLARLLLGHLVEEARARRVRLIVLEVRRSNEPALALYRSFGFQLARVRRDYYQRPCEDALELVLELDPALTS